MPGGMREVWLPTLHRDHGPCTIMMRWSADVGLTKLLLHASTKIDRRERIKQNLHSERPINIYRSSDSSHLIFDSNTWEFIPNVMSLVWHDRKAKQIRKIQIQLFSPQLRLVRVEFCLQPWLALTSSNHYMLIYLRLFIDHVFSCYFMHLITIHCQFQRFDQIYLPYLYISSHGIRLLQSYPISDQ